MFSRHFVCFLLTNRKQSMYTTDRTPTARLCEMNPLYGPLHPKPPHFVISSSENHRDPPLNIDAALSNKSVRLQHSDKIVEL